MADVYLVSMPFAEVQRPSIALGLLHAALTDTDIRAETIYGNLRFAEMIGLMSYQAILLTPTDHLLGEWCFAGDLFPDFHPYDDAYLDLVLEVRNNGFAADLEQRKEMVRWVRARAAAYIDQFAASILDKQPRIVGCSSVFQQHCASLALLQRIRTLSPETLTVMGGPNCEGEMGVETLRAFPWVDCVVSGEADTLFYDLCRLLLDQGRDADSAALPYGAMTQASVRCALPMTRQPSADPPRSTVRDLDALPIPNYAPYFEAIRTSTLSTQIQPGLLAESSRGCWWGEKSHCTFCGLNGIGMVYRSKSPDRVVAELGELSGRYSVRDFQFVDNILDMSHIKTVLPKLIADGADYALFYETKANLKRDQLDLLAQTGVRWIQPGIESLHDEVLKLIGKGNSALMNLQLLKWCRELGIHASWNMLCGFPGESDAWFTDMAAWLPAMFHLQPPSGVVRVRYDRFSPYHTRSEDYGLTLTPSRTYAYIYPLPEEELIRLAYAFEDAKQPGHMHRGILEQPGHQALDAEVRQWNQLWQKQRPMLRVHDEGKRLRFVDTRPCALVRGWTVSGLAKSVYQICDSAQTPRGLLRHLGEAVTWEEVEPVVEMLCRAKVLLPLHGRLFSLGTHADPPAMPDRVPGGSAGVHNLARSISRGL
jgi:magnesium-protoporphyrin IX monomethyl ester (oxidative) cyclase